MLEQHRIAGDQGGNDGVGGGEEGVVPGRDHQHQAGRHARDMAACRSIGLGAKGASAGSAMATIASHPLDQRAELAAVADRPSHLPGQLRNDFGVELLHRRDEALHHATALGERHQRPFALRLAGLCDRDGRPRQRRRSGRRAYSRPFTGEMQISSSNCRSSDDLEIAGELPVGDRLARLALLPFAGGGIMVDELGAEQLARRLGFAQPLRRLPQGRRQATGSAPSGCS